MSERITAAEATEILRDLARGREDGNGADVWPLYDRAEDAMATVVTLTDDAAAHRTRADSAERDADALRRELARERARAEAEEAARAAAQHTADTLGVRLTAAEAAREAFEASVYAELRAAEGECARLRSLLDVTARELVAAKASAEGWREEVVGLRAIVEGRDVAPTAQEIDAHDGAWVVRYLRPRDPKRGERVAFCGAGWRQNARDMAAQHETTWWLPLDREGRPTAWPVPA